MIQMPRTYRGFAALIFFALGAFFVLAHFSPRVETPFSPLALAPTHEPLTELYFNDYASLPSSAIRGANLLLSFTVRNLEGRDLRYPYQVYSETLGGARTLLASSTLALPDGESVSVPISFRAKTDALRVIVSLPTVHEEIHVTLPRTDPS